MPIFVIEIVIDFSERAVLILKKIWKKSVIGRTRLFQWNRFRYAENRHSPSGFFFGKWVELMNVYVVCVLWMT